MKKTMEEREECLIKIEDGRTSCEIAQVVSCMSNERLERTLIEVIIKRICRWVWGGGSEWGWRNDARDTMQNEAMVCISLFRKRKLHKSTWVRIAVGLISDQSADRFHMLISSGWGKGSGFQYVKSYRACSNGSSPGRWWVRIKHRRSISCRKKDWGQYSAVHETEVLKNQEYGDEFKYEVTEWVLDIKAGWRGTCNAWGWEEMCVM